MNLILLNHNRS